MQMSAKLPERGGQNDGERRTDCKVANQMPKSVELAVAGSNGGVASKWLVQWGDAHTGTQGNLGRDRRVHSKRERRGNGRHSPQTNPSRTARLILISNLGPPPENRSTVEIPTSTLQNTKSESDRNRIGFGSESESDRNRIGIGSESARKRNRIGIGSESDRNRIEIGSESDPLFLAGRNRIGIGSKSDPGFWAGRNRIGIGSESDRNRIGIGSDSARNPVPVCLDRIGIKIGPSLLEMEIE